MMLVQDSNVIEVSYNVRSYHKTTFKLELCINTGIIADFALPYVNGSGMEATEHILITVLLYNILLLILRTPASKMGTVLRFF